MGQTTKAITIEGEKQSPSNTNAIHENGNDCNIKQIEDQKVNNNENETDALNNDESAAQNEQNHIAEDLILIPSKNEQLEIDKASKVKLANFSDSQLFHSDTK